MQRIVSVLIALFFSFTSSTFVYAQGSPSPAKAEKSGAPAGAGTRKDVYHVHFAKAALGKAAELGDFLKTPDPKSPMPGHELVLRHQEGDAWDYCVITHMGTKATVEAAGNPAPPDKRDLFEWHNDTFVNLLRAAMNPANDFASGAENGLAIVDLTARTTA